MYGNGVRIGTMPPTTAAAPLPTLPVLLPALTAFFVGAVGTAMPRTVVWLPGTAARHRARSATTASAWLFPVLTKKIKKKRRNNRNGVRRGDQN